MYAKYMLMYKLTLMVLSNKSNDSFTKMHLIYKEACDFLMQNNTKCKFMNYITINSQDQHSK